MDIQDKKESLIRHLVASGYLKTPRIIDAFRKVPREMFVPEEYKTYAYSDEPLPIGRGQTISAPHMVAIMTELLEPTNNDKILEIGTGSGYQTAILSYILKNGEVFSIEYDEVLGERAKQILKELGFSNVFIKIGDGYFGWEEKAPFDGIIITCATPEIPPPLIEQLKEGGRIVAPVGDLRWAQSLIKVTKVDGRLISEDHGGCVFVPMRGEVEK